MAKNSAARFASTAIFPWVRAAMIVILVVTPSLISAAEWRGGGGLYSRLLFSDNIDLSPPGFERSGAVLQVLPFVSLVGTGRRATASIRYAPSVLMYPDSGDRNNIYHVLDARTKLDLVPDYLALSIDAKANQVLASSIGSAGFDGIANPDAYRQTASIRVTPSLTLPLLSGQYASLRIEPGLGSVFEASTSGDEGTRTATRDSRVRIVSGPAFASTSWSIDWRQRIFDVDTDEGVGSLRVNYATRFGSRYSLNAQVGFDDGTYVSSTGETRGLRWLLTGRWTPTARTSMELGGGRAYYGPLGRGELFPSA